MTTLQKILPILERALPLGEKILGNQTRLIGRANYIWLKGELLLIPDGDGWLHAVFPPLTDEGLAQMEQKMEMSLPDVLATFFKTANGLNIYKGSLSIEGLRTNFARKGDAAWQPYDIVLPNLVTRRSDPERNRIFLGSYYSDGSRLYMDRRSEKVFRCPAEQLTTLNEWSSFEEMLLTETERIAALFDAQGRPIDLSRPSTP